jgi:hypothetical protein
MGIGSVFGSSSNTKKKTTTNITTTNVTKTTSTNKVGDIGLTGVHAVKLGETVGQTGENLLRISGKAQAGVMLKAADTMRDVSKMNVIQQKEASNYAQALMTGAASSSKQLLSSAKEQSSALLSSAGAALQTASDQKQSENKYLIPYILIGIVGIVFAMKGLK